MKKQWHLITGVEPDGIGEECGLEPGDRIGAINGHEIEDFFDYQYYIEEEFLRVEVLTKDNEECTLEIEKEEDEDLGITFESFLMDEYQSCCNKCVFCFIDQMPPGMRETLYFKDDDSRLSFLQGNYITHQHERKGYRPGDPLSSGADQYICAHHEPGTALPDAAQPVCRRYPREDPPVL